MTPFEYLAAVQLELDTHSQGATSFDPAVIGAAITGADADLLARQTKAMEVLTDVLSTKMAKLEVVVDITKATIALFPTVLEGLKQVKRTSIDNNTDGIIDQGFWHPRNRGLLFGLEDHDQKNFLSLNALRLAGVDMTDKFFRLTSNLDDPANKNYYFQSNADFDILRNKGINLIEFVVSAGGVLKNEVTAAVSEAELDAIQDTRTWEGVNETLDAGLLTKEGAGAFRVAEIDQKTTDLINAGFTYGGQRFSLSVADQSSWHGLLNASTLGLLPYPVTVSTKDDKAFSLANHQAVVAFYATDVGTVNACLVSGRNIKVVVQAYIADPEKTVQDIFAIVDPR